MYAHTAELPLVTGTPLRARRSFATIAWSFGAALLVLSSFGGALAWRSTTMPAAPAAEAPSAFVVASLGDRPTHDHRYRAEVASVSSRDADAGQRWIVRLERRDHRRVNGARIAARAWMPDEPTQPVVPVAVTRMGGGRYRLDGLRFTRPGWWNVALVVDGARGVDSVAFNVVLR